MTFGLSDTGFVKMSLEDILAEIEADEIAEISPGLDVSSSSPLGQVNAVFAKQASAVWDAAQAIYDQYDPDKATGDGQDALCALTGTRREEAQKSYVRQTMNLSAGVTVPIGSQASPLGDPSIVFELVGTEAVAGTVVAEDLESVGAGTYYARFRCTVAGAVVVNAGTLTVIVTPVTGWNSTTNALDAVVGAPVETSSALRQRREDELQAQGTSPVDALRADLLQLEGIDQCTVFENATDTTDGNGLPPHSIECLVYDGPSPATADNDIAQKIWDGKAAGIQTYGSTTGDAEDTQGNTRVMSFSRPDQKTVYFTIDIDVTDSYPGDAVLQAAIVAYGVANLAMGDDVILAAFYGTIFGVGGVEDVTAFKAGFTAVPVGTGNLSIALRELATFDTSRVVINS